LSEHHGRKGASWLSLSVDLVAGIFLFLAGVAGLIATWSLPTGTVARMGAGFWPQAVSLLLCMFGVGVAALSFTRKGELFELPPLRPYAAVFGAMVLFGLLFERIGMIPTVIVTMLVAGLASIETRWVQLSILAVVLAILSAVAFVRLLGLPLPVFWWR